MSKCAVCEHPVEAGELCENCGFQSEPDMLPIDALEELEEPAPPAFESPSGVGHEGVAPTCPQCNAVQSEVSPVVCSACGYRLALRRVVDDAEASKRCKECGVRSASNVERCRNCGTRL